MKLIICPDCGGSGFTGYSSGYDDVCNTCGGDRQIMTNSEVNIKVLFSLEDKVLIKAMKLNDYSIDIYLEDFDEYQSHIVTVSNCNESVWNDINKLKQIAVTVGW